MTRPQSRTRLCVPENNWGRRQPSGPVLDTPRLLIFSFSEANVSPRDSGNVREAYAAAGPGAHTRPTGVPGPAKAESGPAGTQRTAPTAGNTPENPGWSSPPSGVHGAAKPALCLCWWQLCSHKKQIGLFLVWGVGVGRPGGCGGAAPLRRRCRIFFHCLHLWVYSPLAPGIPAASTTHVGLGHVCPVAEVFVTKVAPSTVAYV